MKRPLRIASHHRNNDILVADAAGKIVCTLPRDEQRLARFIVRFANVFSPWLRSYSRDDWWMERNPRHQ